MSNRLRDETSPYLLQHAENPVDWYPWGDEAFEKARAEDKPVFLSVGYSACHWCHVMAHESFENEQTATLMNERFVSIKVDREERPDVDAIYMDAVQALTGRGGWPMSVFLTPDAEPFYGGTYFPGVSRYGIPSFAEVLERIADLWTKRRAEVTEAASSLTQALGSDAVLGAVSDRERPGLDTLDTAVRALARDFDRENGGWGMAPKFPQPSVPEFLMRRSIAVANGPELEMVTRTLDAMLRGGIYDQLGGGFHRYATDSAWLVPHFEKMLYDNAQLARVYLHAWQITREERYRRAVIETLDYVVREMCIPLGGFLSAQDADSEGVEGHFFVWTPEEVRRVLAAASGDDADAELFMSAYGVTASGNFDGANILSVVRSASEIARDLGTNAAEVQARLDRCRQVLLAAREKRIRPGVDDKVLAGWNGLMLGAFAEAARVLDRSDYLDVAIASANFLLTSMRTTDGRMLRTWKNGHAKLNGYLEDYASVADGLLELYQSTFDPRWFEAARELADAILDHFADKTGGFFDTSDDHEALVVRPKGVADGATPSGGAMAAGILMRLTHYTGDGRYADAAEGALAQMRDAMERHPLGLAYWLSVLDFALAPRELAIVGEPAESLLDVVRSRYRPSLVVAAGSSGHAGSIAVLQDREAIDGRATAYVCRQFACERPVTGASELEALLG